MIWLFALALLPLLPSLSTAVTHDSSFTPDAVLRVTSQNISIGGIQRLTTLVNGTLPGPSLRVKEGSQAWIRVYNDMTKNVTMHWHGLAMAAYPFSDGTPLASQWPIPPGHFFDYELALPDDSAGTYFYHSHVGFQFVSASGPLIVEDKKVPYKYSAERIVYLQELFNKTDTTVEQGLTATPFVFSGETNGFIINGKTISNYGITDNSSVGLSIIKVKPSTTYRFRFIGAHSLTLASLGIQNHSFNIIEADGAYTQPSPVRFLQFASGQRFSGILTTKACTDLAGIQDYYIQVESRERPKNSTNYAILRYDCGLNQSLSEKEYPSKKAISLPPTDNAFLDYTLRPLKNNNFPPASQVTRRVIINVQQILDKWIIWRDANVTWVENDTDTAPHTSPTRPYLVSLYQNESQYLPSYEAALKNGGVDPATKTFPGRIGEVLEIVLQNYGAHAIDNETAGGLDVHPWHAHGEHYYDIGAGPGLFDPAVAEQKLQGTQPVLRDTTMLYRYNASVKPDEAQGWRAWRLRVQEPGVWMIHCHTIQHNIMGMQTVWVFGDSAQVMALPKVQVEGYLSYGGSAYGNDTHAPDVVEFGSVSATNGG